MPVVVPTLRLTNTATTTPPLYEHDEQAVWLNNAWLLPSAVDHGLSNDTLQRLELECAAQLLTGDDYDGSFLSAVMRTLAGPQCDDYKRLLEWATDCLRTTGEEWEDAPSDKTLLMVTLQDVRCRASIESSEPQDAR